VRLLRSPRFLGSLFITCALVALVCVALWGERLVLWWEDVRSGHIQEEELPDEEAPAAQIQEREILLFFERQDNQRLAPETGTIYDLANLSDRAKQVVELLIQGPQFPEHAPTLPGGTTLREFFLSPDGTAYVDFSLDLARRHPGGATSEVNSVYSVVNSLTHNFREIRRVQILVQGREVETLSGHLLLSRPLSVDYTLVDTRVPSIAEAPPAEEEPGDAATGGEDAPQ
jgi:hypothetical protein